MKRRAGPHRGASTPPGFPVVGVGASAGGLEAFSQFLGALPSSTGMAFVLVQHLDPSHESLLAAALARTTPLPVREIRDRTALEPDNVYIVAPNTDVRLVGQLLRVKKASRPAGRAPTPIDRFFESLATERGELAIGVVLSGTGSDGTEGLRAIRGAGGITLAQEPTSARFDGMPRSAIAAGVVDLVQPVTELASGLVGVERHLSKAAAAEAGAPTQEHLAAVLAILRSTLGVDFSDYKSATVERRLARRMALRRVAGLAEYVGLLEHDRAEVAALHEDILIHVTAFFRDPEVFEELEKTVIPEILKRKPPGAPIRVWVVGCSTGEEAYSLAMSILEAIGEKGAPTALQIFGTDLSEHAIELARGGCYAESAVRNVSPERLRKFFTKTDQGYKVIRALRERCIFVRHDVTRDPPFSHLDLVSCRNVLIYFDQDLQSRVLAGFHFCLDEGGFLVLGRTETTAAHGELFSVLNRTHKIFQAKKASRRIPVPATRQSETPGRPSRAPPSKGATLPRVDVRRQADAVLLARYSPPGVVIDERGHILQFRGHTGVFLEPSPGEPQQSIFKMLREGMVGDVRLALAQAKKRQQPVQREGLRVRHEDGERVCRIAVVPLSEVPAEKATAFLVIFEEAAPQAVDARRGKGRRADAATANRESKLERELAATKDYLESLIQEHEHATEALTGVNEELVSGNEELQSINEELETAKEELQSTNEELTTVNDELQARIQEQTQLNDDLVNVLASVEMPIVIVDADRRIRRFTPRARAVLSLLPADIGRPIADLRPSFDADDLDARIAHVIETVTPFEREVQDRNGRWQRIQIRPYKTVENRIDGAVLSLVDVDALRRAVGAAEWARDYAAGIVEAVQVPLVAFDGAGKVLSANAAYFDLFRASRVQTLGRSLFELGGGWCDRVELRKLVSDATGELQRATNVVIDADVRPLGLRTFSVAAGPVRSPVGGPMALLAIEDITERRRLEAERQELLSASREAGAKADEANRAKDVFLATLSHELRTPLTPLLLQAQVLRKTDLTPAALARACDMIERSVRMQAQLIDDLLDVSRITTGKLKIELGDVDLGAVVRSAVETVQPLADLKKIRLEVSDDGHTGHVRGDPARLRQVVWNLLTNAIRFTPISGRVSLSLAGTDRSVEIRVTDTGAGIEPDFLPRVFDPFCQEDASVSRSHGGLGLGLAIVHVVEAHGGSVRAESEGRNKGATFTVELPRGRDEPSSPTPGPARIETPGPAAVSTNGSGIAGASILVVEDDGAIRDSLVDFLASRGATVRAARSAVEARALHSRQPPDVILCDLAMPGEDGYALLQSLRAAGSTVPAVAVTALASEPERARTLAEGFAAHVAKPVDGAALERVLAKLLRARGTVTGP